MRNVNGGRIFWKQTAQGVLWLSLANALLGWFVFRDALWGGSLLAPLDIAPACFSQYRFVDPTSTGVIKGSAQFDQVFYDLPLQHGIYQSYRSGVIPWWDPYGFTGRPLLADAHINGTDPIRLLAYAALPFELAYNWTLIGHFVASGLAMFALLRFWRLRPWICVLLALTFEFAGSQTFFFGFPWLHGSILYYPVLWLAWEAALKTGRVGWWGLASLALAGIFYSGNLQSHAYVVLFTAAFAIGYAGLAWPAWRRAIPMLVGCGLGGACLAAPVLLNQLEFFHEGMRGVKSAASSRVYFTGLASLTSIYPWMLGDFRTIDVRSALFQSIGFAQNYGLGFHTYVGSAGLILALLGAFRKPATADSARIRRTAFALCLLFLIIISSPLIGIFYTRSAGMFVLGAVALAALGLENLRSSPVLPKRLGWSVALVALGLALATNIGAFVVYPRVLPKLQKMMQDRDSAAPPGAIFQMPAAYRNFQLTNLPNEISFKNPEAFLAFLSLLAMAGLLLRPDLRAQPAWLNLLLVLNLAPLILYAGRFIPKEPLISWQRLLEGGPEQQRVLAALSPGGLRLFEEATLRNEYLFPDAIEHLYKVQTIHGYSALVPKSVYGLGLISRPEDAAQYADYTFGRGELRRQRDSGAARFQWLAPSERSLEWQRISLNQLQVQFTPGPAGALLWTDTWYPGWVATVDGQPAKLTRETPCFGRIEIPSEAKTLTLSYRPRYLSIGQILAVVGAIGVAGAWIFGGSRPTARLWPESHSVALDSSA